MASSLALGLGSTTLHCSQFDAGEHQVSAVEPRGFGLDEEGGRFPPTIGQGNLENLHADLRIYLSNVFV